MEAVGPPGAAWATLGVWAATPAGAAEAVSFDASAPAGAFGAWRLDLPREPREADAILALGEAQAAEAQAQLAALPNRLEALARLAAQPAAVAFATEAAGGAANAAESRLLAALTRLRSAPGPEAVSYGAERPAEAGQRQALSQFQAFAAQVGDLLRYAARVETHTAGQLLGLSTVGWSGETRTVWGRGLRPDQAARHARALALAVATRLVWLQCAVTVLRGAARLAVLAAAPGGPVVAVPAVWTFVNEVLAQAGQLQALAQQRAEGG